MVITLTVEKWSAVGFSDAAPIQDLTIIGDNANRADYIHE
jgi:hypothetical protein